MNSLSSTAGDGAVLVTGGAGYIGSHAVLALLDAGWRVVVLDNLVTGFRWAVAGDAIFYEGDIADGPLVASIIADHDIGAIIHFAGSVVVPESVSDPLKYYHNNTAKSRAAASLAGAWRGVDPAISAKSAHCAALPPAGAAGSGAQTIGLIG